MPDLKLLAISRQLRDRAEEARGRAETFHDPEAKRLMHQIAATYEELAQRLEREAGVADKG
jgi:O-methyltransferase involved in polyketide biosynthesis